MNKHAALAARAAAVLAAAGTVSSALPGHAIAAADTSAARVSVAVAETANPAKQYANGSSVYVNPNDTGSFTVTVNATDTDSGVAFVAFPPMLGSRGSIDRTAPFTRTYTWPTAATAPGEVKVVVKNGAGISTKAALSVLTDATAPLPGARITHPTGRTAASTATVQVTPGGGDTGSGIERRALNRRNGTTTAGSCQPSDITWIANATTEAITDTTLTPGGCYTYRLVEADRVGNVRVTDGPGALIVNSTPVAKTATITTKTATAVPVTLQASDADGDPLTYQVVQAPANGTLTGTAPALTYTPKTGFTGTDTFTYTASDATSRSTPAKISITVGATTTTPALTKGIISQGAPAAGHDYVNHVTGGTAIHWKDLETADQVFTGPAWAKIDTLLANPRVDGIRLRVYAGRYAPDFVKKIGGPGVSGAGYDCSVSGGIAVYNPYDKTGGCVPRFWQDAALDEYEELMREIARRYANNPKLAEIVSSACMTTYAEPFYRAHSDTASNQRLWNAGLNRSTDLACQDRSMTITTTVFPTRATSLAINPWEIIVDPAVTTGGLVRDWTATYQFAQKWKTRLGNRLVLQNNGWGENDGCPAGKTPTTNVYCYLAQVADPKGYQSETWPRLGDTLAGNSLKGWYQALENAIAAGACAIESTDNQYRQADPVKMADYDRRLEANC